MHRIPVLAALALLAPGLPAQSSLTLPAGFLTTQGTSSTSYPFNSATDHTWQWHYDSAQFQTSGPVTITEIWVRASTATASVASFACGSFDVVLGASTTHYSVAGGSGLPGHHPTFANNLAPGAAMVRTGPWSHAPVPPSGTATAAWIPLGLATNFPFDPVASPGFIVQLHTCGVASIWGTALDGATGIAGQAGGNRYGDISSCVATSSTFQNNEFVPIIRVDYFERNRLSMSQSAPGAGDLLVTLDMVPASAAGGFTLATSLTSLPAGTGPMFGIYPEFATFGILSIPYQPGNPFHFSTADPAHFPQAPAFFGPGSVLHLQGQTIDFVCVLYDIGSSLDSVSNVLRFTFQ